MYQAMFVLSWQFLWVKKFKFFATIAYKDVKNLQNVKM
jgi:hypothetical protein